LHDGYDMLSPTYVSRLPRFSNYEKVSSYLTVQGRHLHVCILHRQKSLPLYEFNLKEKRIRS